MIFKAKYVVEEDRIQLCLHPVDSPPLAFWLTRRQCVALIRILQEVLKTTSPVKLSPPSARIKPTKPTLSPASELSPELVRLRWRRLPKGLRLVFSLSKKANVRLDLGIAELSRLQTTLLQLARRAQWDVEATLQRLAAQTPKPPALH